MSTDPCGHTAGKDAPPLADRRPQPEAQMFTLKTSQTMKSKPLLSRSAPATLSLNRLWSLVAISLLAGWGFPQLGQASTPDGARSTSTTALQASPDFVHDECVFDSCYTFFVRLNDRVGRTRYGATFMAHTVWMNPSAVYFGQRDNVRTLQRVAREFQDYQQGILSSSRYDEAAEKAKLVRQLTAFRDTATALPYLYATIDREYGGNIPAYVDALFENSAITNPKRMKRLVRKVTKRRLKNDMGFQFVVSKYVYRLWLDQGRPKAAQGDGIYVFPMRKE